jgi:pyruvate formate lyase activating enzyme
MIFNIQRFSTHDGEGIRTVIFFKGCPLHCLWCSNPEGIPSGYSIMYDQRLCKEFGECMRVERRAIKRTPEGIHIDRSKISRPEQLKDICPSKALTVIGEEKSVAELVEEVEKDLPFYRDQGGVTLSGGEPLFQDPAILIPLLKELQKRNIPVDIETSLHLQWEKIKPSIDLVTTFLVDIKHTDKEKFRTFTRGDLRLVMANFEKLTASGASIIVRIPVIPGFNHTRKEMYGIIDFVHYLGIQEIHFLPYHILGTEKYKMLGLPYLFGNRTPVKDPEVYPYVQYAEKKGLLTKIGG